MSGKTIDLRCGDCLSLLKTLRSNSIDLILTDPPYFLDSLDDGWSPSDIRRKTARAKTVGGLPVGMKFDPRQGRRLEAFFFEVSMECIRVLKPGGFMVAFSQGRLVHRLAVAAEDAGFEIRDLCVWEHEGGQGKAFTQGHFVKKMDISESNKQEIIDRLGGRKTPQLRPKFEPMIIAQKPRDGTFVSNWLNWGTGLVQLEFPNEDYQQTTVFTYKKPHKNREFNHMTIKPVELFERLIQVFTVEGQCVLDPFLGSGTAAEAALRTGRRIVGFEINPEYLDVALTRTKGLKND